MNDFVENRVNFDFEKFGCEIKSERERRGWTREKAAAMLDISESYLKTIENTGATPGFQLFFRLATLFSISVDKHFFPKQNFSSDARDKSLYLQANNLLQECGTEELYVLISTMDGMNTARKLRAEKSEEEPST